MQDLERAYDECDKADLIICMGSSLTVSPANDLPKRVAKHGGNLVIINLQRTPLDKLRYALWEKAFMVTHFTLQHSEDSWPYRSSDERSDGRARYRSSTVRPRTEDPRKPHKGIAARYHLAPLY